MAIKIAILGRKKDTVNYENFLRAGSFEPYTTMNPYSAASCNGLILPGGGDITPAFFGEYNRGSRNIDTELDILQLQALDFCLHKNLPVLGICKGMQLINVAFGGTITQDMADSSTHLSADGDCYHSTIIDGSGFLCKLYGRKALVNSAHHQCVGRIGHGLRIVQRCETDECPEALMHEILPILGLQWHPERLDPTETNLSGLPVLSFFANVPSTPPKV